MAFRRFHGMFLAFLIIIYHTHRSMGEEDAELVMVNLVYRHGDRSPVTIFPKDTHKENSWPNGLGWLTKVGMNQHHTLGQWFRHRYMNESALLNSSYKHNEIEVASSNEDRCLMSAYSNLAGFYPPSDQEKFDPSIGWQPIPVHTRPEKEDNVINMGMFCSRYNDLYEETISSKEVQAEENRNKAFYELLQKSTGYEQVNIRNVWKPADTLFCEKTHNMTLDPWALGPYGNSTVYEKLRELDAWQFHLMYYNKEMAKLKGGPLLKEMRDNMVNASGVNYTGPKLYMFSGHDTTVAALLSALGLYENITGSPVYAATVMLELYKKGEFYYVEIHYKDNHETLSNASRILKLEGCDKQCELKTFLSLTASAVPKDWRRECETHHHSKKSGVHLRTSEIISIVLAVVLIVTLVCLIVTCVKLKRSSDGGYKSFTNPDM